MWPSRVYPLLEQRLPRLRRILLLSPDHTIPREQSCAVRATHTSHHVASIIRLVNEAGACRLHSVKSFTPPNTHTPTLAHCTCFTSGMSTLTLWFSKCFEVYQVQTKSMGSKVTYIPNNCCFKRFCSCLKIPHLKIWGFIESGVCVKDRSVISRKINGGKNVGDLIVTFILRGR